MKGTENRVVSSWRIVSQVQEMISEYQRISAGCDSVQNSAGCEEIIGKNCRFLNENCPLGWRHQGGARGFKMFVQWQVNQGEKMVPKQDGKASLGLAKKAIEAQNHCVDSQSDFL